MIILGFKASYELYNNCQYLLTVGSEASSFHIKLTVMRQTDCVHIGFTLTQPATSTSCYIDSKKWDKCKLLYIACACMLLPV